MLSDRALLNTKSIRNYKKRNKSCRKIFKKYLFVNLKKKKKKNIQ